MNPEKENPRPAVTGRGLQRGAGTAQRNHSTDPAALLLERLDRVRESGPDQWIARCPAHDDRSPSVSIKRTNDRLLVYCFAGCDTGAVLAAVGLTLADLFAEPLSNHRKPLSDFQRRRHDQARAALRALTHEVRIVHVLAEQMAAGFALDPSERQRLRQAMNRVENARRLAA